MNFLSTPLQSFLNLDFGLTLPNQPGDRVAAVETPSLPITIAYQGKGLSADVLAGTEQTLTAVLIEGVPRSFDANFDFSPTLGLINPPEETAITLLQGNGWLNPQVAQEHSLQNPAVTCRCPFCTNTLNFQTTDLANGTPAVAMATTSLANTFFLHSKPTATKTIYLDFNGHTLPANTAWTNSENGGNAINAPAWSLDSDPAFNDTELARIQAIWQRVAEDFAPFDVNVTTQLLSEDYLTRSSSSDQVYGTRALISPISSYFGNYGGIAYVDVFDSVGDYYKPALVFPENLGNGEKNIAEAITHEVGHNLGLDHDGTPTDGYYSGHGSGATGWAPIMGVGYYQPLSQWSKGEYVNANNLEDDLNIITTQNGFSYRSDDFGNTLATASLLSVSNLNINQFGLIERSTDQDWFQFSTGTGDINLAINPITQTYIYNNGNYSIEYLTPPSGSSNLDIWAGIYDTNGQLLFQSNPVDLLTANFSNVFLNAGTYYLAIDGVGKGDLTTGYSDYGSLGQYYITGNLVQPVANAAILVSPTSGLTTTEAGGQATFTVVLNQAPTANVTIGLSSSNPNEGTVNVSSIVFTNSNWNIAQTVTITGVNDTIIDGNQAYSIVLAPAVSSDSRYNGLDATDVSVVNTDNDFPIVNIASSPQTIVEGLTSNQVVSYTVTLNTAGSKPLTVQYTTSNGTASSGSDYISSSGTLTFNPGVTSQAINISILNDALSEADETFTLTLSNPSNGMLGSTPSVVTTITDTLTTAITTTLPAGVEKLTLTGSAAVNGTGNAGNNSLTGNDAINTLKGGGGVDILTGGNGYDRFDLSAISTSANRNTITDWTVGDTVLLSDSLTTRVGLGSPTTAIVSQATSVNLNTATTDLFLFNFNNTETGVDLGASLNGSMLLDGLSNSTRTDNATLNASAARGQGYILAYDNGNGYLYYFNSGSNRTISASEIALVGIFDSQSDFAVGSFTGSNFALI
ncbi:Calx-beta domain-containing protein [Synechocystis sp. LKSZ1]|uniref:Calx-beta domain-containing protein n=1 Tax=Synechocystis sp. LKSZ1 TaxID=3144951 RepID=UPI00336BE649